MSAVEAPSWGDLFDMAHAAMLLAGGIGYLWLWRRHRYWLPRYVHVLALGGMLVTALAVWVGGSIDPAGGLWIVLFMPLLIYFVFVFYGGAEAARKRHERSKRAE